MDVSCLHWVIMLLGTANHYTNTLVICEHYIHHLAEVGKGRTGYGNDVLYQHNWEDRSLIL
jgi:hypothetical protein